jgi:uncharacterized protein (UPF0261 family)
VLQWYLKSDRKEKPLKNKTALIIATLDTKAQEALFVKNLIEERGVNTLVMDTGTTGQCPFTPDIPSHKIAGAVSRTLPELLSFHDESKAMGEMAKGAEIVVTELLEKSAFDGVIALGGTMGTSLALRVFQKLPTGLLKMLVSTVALSYFVTPQRLRNDIVLFQVASDLWGLNRLAKRDLTRAALATACALESDEENPEHSAPFVTMTTLGGSFLKYAFIVKKRLEEKGYEVAIFHSVSMQGGIMERLIDEGKVDGVLDLCPQELLSEIAGGHCCSPGRMEAASRNGIPQVVGPGGLGFFPSGALKDLPEKFKGRFTFSHNEIATGIQATTEEMTELAKTMASKLNSSRGPVAVIIPERGFLEYDRPGDRLHYPEGRRIFVDTLGDYLSPDIEFIKMDCHINDPEYAETVTEAALKLFKDAL